MNRVAFDLYLETHSCRRYDRAIIILDNLSVHKAHRPRPLFVLAARACCSSRNTRPTSTRWMAFAKLKAHLRAAAARLPDTLIATLGRICGLFPRTELPKLLQSRGICVQISERCFSAGFHRGELQRAAAVLGGRAGGNAGANAARARP